MENEVKRTRDRQTVKRNFEIETVNKIRKKERKKERKTERQKDRKTGR